MCTTFFSLFYHQPFPKMVCARAKSGKRRKKNDFCFCEKQRESTKNLSVMEDEKGPHKVFGQPNIHFFFP